MLVTDYSTPTGGVELRLLDLQRALIARGHDVRLFSSSAREPEHQTMAQDLCFGTLSRFRTILQTFNISAYLRLKKTLAEFAPDVVHVNVFLTQLSPLILPALADYPTIYNAAWYRAICPTGTKMLPDRSACHVRHGSVCASNRCISKVDSILLGWQMNLLKRWRHHIDVTVANSDAVRRRLEADDFGPSEVIHNGIPINDQAPARSNSLSPHPKVVFAGRLVNTKGVDILLSAFATVRRKFPTAELLVAGSGPESTRLKTLAADLGIADSVTFLGTESRGELDVKFADAWVQAVPSVWEEPFGLVAVEAMMRGIPVIATKTGGLTEIVEHDETGILIAPGSSDELANAIATLLSNRQLALKLGQQAREVALAKFSHDAFVDKFLSLYVQLSKKNGQEATPQEVLCSR